MTETDPSGGEGDGGGLACDGGSDEEYKSQRRYTEEELLEKLREIAEEEGETPTQKMLINREDAPSPATYHNRFDSLTKAQEKAGLKPNSRGAPQKYTDEELLSWIDAFVNEFGVVPRSDDFRDADPMPQSMLYNKRFGSWEEALQEAGYTLEGGDA